MGMTIMRRRSVIDALCGIALSALALAPAHAADSAAAKEKAEICAGCHGDGGISQTENIPSLAGQPDQFIQWQLVFFRGGARENAEMEPVGGAGQPDQFIQWQLVFFRGGARKNEQMQPIAEQISNEDIRALGAYFAVLTP